MVSRYYYLICLFWNIYTCLIFFPNIDFECEHDKIVRRRTNLGNDITFIVIFNPSQICLHQFVLILEWFEIDPIYIRLFLLLIRAHYTHYLYKLFYKYLQSITNSSDLSTIIVNNFYLYIFKWTIYKHYCFINLFNNHKICCRVILKQLLKAHVLPINCLLE